MCTVTYLPSLGKSGFILTSNRDERVFRPALRPQIYQKGKITLCYPKDPKAGGSWISINNRGRLCCLLNGGFVVHKKQAFHTKSRGQVLIGFASSDENVQEYFDNEDLSQVEPFTLISIDLIKSKETSFNEFIWDGEEKHNKFLDPALPYLWSSVTLYSKENRELRREWFYRFIKSNSSDFTPEEVLAFHSGKHTTDITNNLVMERDDGLKTLSITQVMPKYYGFKMQYIDLVEGSQNEMIL